MRYLIEGMDWGDPESVETVGMVKTVEEIQAAIDVYAAKNGTRSVYVASIWDIENCVFVDYINNLHATK